MTADLFTQHTNSDVAPIMLENDKNLPAVCHHHVKYGAYTT